MKIEYWVKNITENDLSSKDLQLTIKCGKPYNLCALNPNLTHEMLRQSEEDGFLRRCFDSQKLIKLPFAPKISTYNTQQRNFISSPMPSRVKTAVVMDATHQDFVEELSGFDDEISERKYADGFVDILAEDGTSNVEIVAGESGENFDGKPFRSVSIKPVEIDENESSSGIKIKVVERRNGRLRDIVVEPE